MKKKYGTSRIIAIVLLLLLMFTACDVAGGGDSSSGAPDSDSSQVSSDGGSSQDSSESLPDGQSSSGSQASDGSNNEPAQLPDYSNPTAAGMTDFGKPNQSPRTAEEWYGDLSQYAPSPDPAFPPSYNTNPGTDIQINLAPYYNVDAFAYTANPSDGEFDDATYGNRILLPADGLKRSYTHKGTTFNLGPFDDGQLNAVRCYRQYIKLDTPVECDSIEVVMLSLSGDWMGDVADFRVLYTDGSWQNTQHYLHYLWYCLPGDDGVVDLPYVLYSDSNGKNFAPHGGPYSLQRYSLDCDAGHKIEGIYLPFSTYAGFASVMFSMTLKNAR